jgi:enoyl-CoA hydratase
LSKELVVETRSQDGILFIKLNRPSRRNAINADVARGLLNAVRRLENDDALRVGILSGAGSGFCSGMDLDAYKAEGVPGELDEFLGSSFTKPLIAAVEGFALAGGFELALRCDLLIAARGARFGLPEVKVGLLAPYGLGFLHRSLSHQLAAEIILTGEAILAERAFELGLVNRLTQPGFSENVAIEIATQIVANAPLAISASLSLLKFAVGLSESDYLVAMRPTAAGIYSSVDSLEGASAFLEHRRPIWEGR